MRRFAVIGIDGAEPSIVEKLLKEGKLPALAELKDRGAYSKLNTTTVSQSPVAWSSFQTGLSPAKHNIYDFIIRKPKTLQIDLGMVNERVVSGRRIFEKRIRGKACWHYLSENKLCSLALFIPVTFPAEEINGVVLSGMGTPDLRGAQGLPTIYSTASNGQKEDVRKIELAEKIIVTIEGPPGEEVQAVFERKEGKVVIELQGQKEALAEGEWSKWFRVRFNGIEGVCRFKVLKNSANELSIYLSPISYSPFEPAASVAYPESIAKELAERIDVFKSLSFESDVYGLKEELIDEETWLEDMRYTFETRFKVAKHLLRNTKWNYFAIDLFPVDRVQHLFWRFIDKEHPMYEESSYAELIEKTYIWLDEKLAELMPLFSDALLFVISDHGFQSYRKSVQLNKILLGEGFLAFKGNAEQGGFADIDWSKTLAYALGFGSIYINLKGRERYGIVSEKDVESVKENIREALLKFEFDGGKPFIDVKTSEEVYDSNREMPDLIPIYRPGFRASRETAIGAVSSREIIYDNRNKWSADHIGPFLAEHNAGIIFCSEPLDLKNASILDLAPTALKYFNIHYKGLDGKSLL